MRASVLMSIYNETVEQIKESVASVLSQGFSDIELIIILDKPERTDVKSILDEFDDSRIIFDKNEKNLGLAMSMNRAANLAKSDIFIRMDADDVCLPGRFKREYEILQSSDYDFVFSNYDIIDQNSEIIKEPEVEEDISDSRTLYKMVSLDPSIIHHPTVMFTKEIFERAGGYRNFPCSQDSDLWLRMAEDGCRFYKIGQSYLRYRANPNSVTNKRWYQQQLTCHYIFELSTQRLTKGIDDYSIENYHQYLNRFKVDNEQAKNQLRNAVNLLSESAVASAEGKKLRSLRLRTQVLLMSKVYRRHIYFLLKKKTLLNK